MDLLVFISLLYEKAIASIYFSIPLAPKKISEVINNPAYMVDFFNNYIVKYSSFSKSR